MNSIDRIIILNEYIQDDPLDPFNYYALALEYLKLDEPDKAQVQMEYLYKNHPEYLPNYYHFAQYLYGLGNSIKANQVAEEGMKVARNANDHHTLNELRGLADAHL
jgi:predicted Zn-dependent protease